MPGNIPAGALSKLADRKVLRAIAAPLDDTVPAERAVTLRDLFTFRLGHGAIIAYPERPRRISPAFC